MHEPVPNPWHHLPAHPPFVLPDEAEAIAKHNSRAEEIYQVRLELVPEPYLGNPLAPVVLLNLNPGFCDDDLKYHADADFAGIAKANLLHKRIDYPHFFLDPSLSAPGC